MSSGLIWWSKNLNKLMDENQGQEVYPFQIQLFPVTNTTH